MTVNDCVKLHICNSTSDSWGVGFTCSLMEFKQDEIYTPWPYLCYSTGMLCMLDEFRQRCIDDITDLVVYTIETMEPDYHHGVLI